MRLYTRENMLINIALILDPSKCHTLVLWRLSLIHMLDKLQITFIFKLVLIYGVTCSENTISLGIDRGKLWKASLGNCFRDSPHDKQMDQLNLVIEFI